MSVAVPFKVPSKTTFTPMRVSPDSESTTVPEMEPVVLCACADWLIMFASKSATKSVCFTCADI